MNATNAARGASPEAIQAHYDVGNDFFRLWLDQTLTYSCALWEEGDSLDQAQQRKIDYHITEAQAAGARSVLDIGCGWGEVLRQLVSKHNVERAVGLTLSAAQADFIDGQKLDKIEVRRESWADHTPAEPYDAIISIGAFEHFAVPELSRVDRVAIYRDFFVRARRLLRDRGRMSLQTIAYGKGNFGHGAVSASFPESDLPRLSEIVEACEQLFTVTRLRNDPSHYERTCRIWAQRIDSSRAELLKVASPETIGSYEHMCRAAARGFSVGIFELLRLTLQRVD